MTGQFKRQFSIANRDLSRHLLHAGVMAWQHITGSGGVSQSTWLDAFGSVFMASEGNSSSRLQQDMIPRLSAARRKNLNSIEATIIRVDDNFQTVNLLFYM